MEFSDFTDSRLLFLDDTGNVDFASDGAFKPSLYTKITGLYIMMPVFLSQN